jgi:uncharacterized glyoxalase superfamily protein PhnB
MPEERLIPVLGYPDVDEAVAWLTAAFGFALRWQAGSHRAQLAVGGHGAVAIVQGGGAHSSGDHVMVRVENVDQHRLNAMKAGATSGPVEEFPFGERQYTAHDHTGRTWVFTQTVRDVDPAEWGARTGPGSD